jgi:hypothetical protein
VGEYSVERVVSAALHTLSLGTQVSQPQLSRALGFEPNPVSAVTRKMTNCITIHNIYSTQNSSTGNILEVTALPSDTVCVKSCKLFKSCLVKSVIEHEGNKKHIPPEYRDSLVLAK